MKSNDSYAVMVKRHFYVVVITLSLLSFYGGSTLRAQRMQAPLATNAVYAELFGPGLLYSLNYEYRPSTDYSFRVGVSAFPMDDNPIFSLSWYMFPMSANALLFEGSSHLELSAGLMPSYFNGSFFGTKYGTAFTVIGISNIGYRYQDRSGGMVFRIGLTPLFTFSTIALTGGISAGMAF